MASTATSAPSYMSAGVAVAQPSHLEGDSQLATEILPGPPTVASVKQAVQKRDPRKPTTVYSYLPTNDPGSTYSGIMHGTLIGQDVDGPNRKRSRVDKGALGRAQRASARNQLAAPPVVVEPPVASEVATTSQAPPAPATADPDYPMVIDDEPSSSRANSASALDDSGATNSINGRSKRKDKGKGKEVDGPGVKIKEEPRAVSLHTPEPAATPSLRFTNQDHCSSCRSLIGQLVYCDGCPRAFHLWCLDPPLDSVEEGDKKWYCPSCTVKKRPTRRYTPTILMPLIKQVDNAPFPTEYQLPEDIRTTFKDVGTGDRGNYVDTSEIKPPRLNRHGQLDERDAHRLKDRNNQPVICFRCGKSALPESVVAAAPFTKRARKATAKGAQYEAWKNIISCDYCDLHWHLDCLDPPLSAMPSFAKKWMCPNHSEQVMSSKKRIPKQNAPPIEITKPRQFNNGNIEVIQSEYPSKTTQPQINVDEVLINGRRFRVPERIILLDFWNKISRNGGASADNGGESSRMSSPLTSLSDLEDMDERLPPESSKEESDDMRVAKLLCSLRLGDKALKNAPSQSSSYSASQTESLSAPPTTFVLPPSSSSRPRGRPPKPTRKSLPSLNIKPNASANASGSSTGPPAKRKRTMNRPEVPPNETRELRSKTRQDSVSSKLAEDASSVDTPTLAAPPAPGGTTSFRPRIRVKMEEAEIPLQLNGSLPSVGGSSSAKTTPKRVRTVRKPPAAPPGLLLGLDREEFDEGPKTEKRGRKRKERDDELPYVDRSASGRKATAAASLVAGDETRKRPVRTPTGASRTISNDASIGGSVSQPTTPSLKIRLPARNTNPSPHGGGPNGDTSTKL